MARVACYRGAVSTLSTSTLSIRNETAVDAPGVRQVNRQAFEGNAEAALIDRLLAAGEVIASLVALHAGEVIAHILFSRVTIERDGAIIEAAALGPMAVAPEHQGAGIGSMMVMRGLDLVRRLGISAVLVVGHPGYYPRFGFRADLAAGLEAPYHGESFMALELEEGALAGGGRVRYPAAFAELD